ncbi:hypothetical protein HOLleu_01293 [Holothuria leucospilota]|uniref:Uncharacterized protein n=1 Tax=Holothuria leucospilota TaxID=206669 RepID=A0A9Q1HGB9_HOLLE|nr:hypothetical protein HOLleu_01293 [Holothuria leucospilota]
MYLTDNIFYLKQALDTETLSPVIRDLGFRAFKGILRDSKSQDWEDREANRQHAERSAESTDNEPTQSKPLQSNPSPTPENVEPNASDVVVARKRKHCETESDVPNEGKEGPKPISNGHSDRDFKSYLEELSSLPEVITFKEQTRLVPAIRLLEMSIRDKDFGVVHTRWGRGGDATNLDHFGPDVVSFGHKLRSLISEWFCNYKKTTMSDMFEGLEARGMVFILRVDILFV